MLQVLSNFILWLINRLTSIFLYPLFIGFETGFNINFESVYGNIASFILYIRDFYHFVLSCLGINNYVFNLISGLFLSYILVIGAMRVFHFAINIYNKLKP